MQAGKLRHRFELQVKSSTVTRDAHGGITNAYATVARRWGSLEPLTARELWQAGQVKSQATVRIRLRYYADLTARYRLKEGSDIYNIESIINVGARDREMVVLAVKEG